MTAGEGLGWGEELTTGAGLAADDVQPTISVAAASAVMTLIATQRLDQAIGFLERRSSAGVGLGIGRRVGRGHAGGGRRAVVRIRQEALGGARRRIDKEDVHASSHGID